MESQDQAEIVAEALPEEHVVVFRLSDEYYALDIHLVQEIVRMQTITAIPGAEEWVKGITNLRGRVVPVLDLGRRCGKPVGDVSPETRIVVVNAEDGMVGLTVDAVTEVMRIPGESIAEAKGVVSPEQVAFLRGIAQLPDRLISLMDLEKVLPTAESEARESGKSALIAA